MKNSKDFSIPENIPHASGKFLAHSMAKIALIIVLIGMTIILTFLEGEKELINGFLFLGPVLVFATWIFGYYYGYRDFQEINKYLTCLKQKLEKEVRRLDSRTALDEEVDKKMELLKRKTEAFFYPLILNFWKVDPSKGDSRIEYEKARDIFNEKLKALKFGDLKKIGEELMKEKIVNYIAESISTKARFKIKKNWIEDLDLSNFKEKVDDNVRYNLFLRREMLNKKIAEIKVHIRNSSEEKVFS